MKSGPLKTALYTVGAAAGAYGVYAGLAYARYGTAETDHFPTRLDAFMPDFEVRDIHRREVRAPASVTFEAATRLSMGESPLVRGIFGLRSLPSRIQGTLPESSPARPILEDVRALNWQELEYDPGRSVVMAAVTQPWHADVEFIGMPAEEFRTFDEPGFARIVWSIETIARGPGNCILQMETRVATTDRNSREKFRRYWALLSPGIIAIRFELLRLTKRLAERAEEQPTRAAW